MLLPWWKDGLHSEFSIEVFRFWIICVDGIFQNDLTLNSVFRVLTFCLSERKVVAFLRMLFHSCVCRILFQGEYGIFINVWGSMSLRAVRCMTEISFTESSTNCLPSLQKKKEKTKTKKSTALLWKKCSKYKNYENIKRKLGCVFTEIVCGLAVQFTGSWLEWSCWGVECEFWCPECKYPQKIGCCCGL